MNEGRTNVVTFRVYKWTGMCVCPRASKISFLTHFILQSLLSSLPFFVLCSHGFVIILLHRSFFHLTLNSALPISLPSHQCPSPPLLSILPLHTSSFSSFPILLPVLRQCSLFSLLSPHPFLLWGLSIPKDNPDLGRQHSLWLRNRDGSQREVFHCILDVQTEISH